MSDYWAVSLTIPLDFPDDVNGFSSKLVQYLEQQTGIRNSVAESAFGYCGMTWIFRSDEEAEESEP
jgi:hypothetical protein